MIDRFRKGLQRALRNQRGITGLETAIILIAFVTVASVLAYAVLSAGLFSAERGKETVYEGLKHAQATMETKGSVIATSSDNGTSVDTIKFCLALVLKGEQVDLTPPPNDITVIRYMDNTINTANTTWTAELLSTERGTPNILEADEVIEVTLQVPGETTLEPYDTFTIQVLPPTGAALTLQRTLGGSLQETNNLN